ncbi:MAG: hypothetical protein M9894_14290 [Planctomycetes bacterium]|nr:hypothetical protein [Planctomycetota bacterium]
MITCDTCGAERRTRAGRCPACGARTSGSGAAPAVGAAPPPAAPRPPVRATPTSGVLVVWEVTTDQPHTVELELALSGRETVRVDGRTVVDAVKWGLRSEHRLSVGPAPAALTVTAGLSLQPKTELRVDGRVVAPVRRVGPEASGVSPVNLAVGLLAGLGGAALGKYAGVNLLIVGVAGVLCAGLARVVLPQGRRGFAIPLGVMGGHAGWMALGLLMVGPTGALLDLAVMGGAGLWLALAPGLGPVLLLTGFEAFGVAVNGHAIIGFPLGSPEHRALSLHLALRLGAVFTAWAAWAEWRRSA